jgi:hypothetical protein
VVLAGVLRRWGQAGPVIDRWASAPILGGGRQVGEIRLTALTDG